MISARGNSRNENATTHSDSRRRREMVRRAPAIEIGSESSRAPRTPCIGVRCHPELLRIVFRTDGPPTSALEEGFSPLSEYRFELQLNPIIRSSGSPLRAMIAAHVSEGILLRRGIPLKPCREWEVRAASPRAGKPDHDCWCCLRADFRTERGAGLVHRFSCHRPARAHRHAPSTGPMPWGRARSPS